ncbi:MAG: hypothetical protein QM760_05845 [Nibricoccus sp.]
MPDVERSAKKKMKLKRIAGWALVALGSVGLYCAIMANWVFRDGMGPDSIESHGRVAFERFMEEFWIDALILIPVFITGFWLIFSEKKGANQTQPRISRQPPSKPTKKPEPSAGSGDS